MTLIFFFGGGGVKRWDGKLCVPTEKSWLRPCFLILEQSNVWHWSLTESGFFLNFSISRFAEVGLYPICSWPKWNSRCTSMWTFQGSSHKLLCCVLEQVTLLSQCLSPPKWSIVRLPPALRWLNRVMQDHEARASDLNRKLILSFFCYFPNQSYWNITNNGQNLLFNSHLWYQGF